MKKQIKGLLALLLVATLVTGCGCTNKDNKKDNTKDDVKVNTEENVIKDQTFEGLTFTNTSLTTTNGVSTLITEVSNSTGSDYTLEEFTITIKNKDGEVITTIPGYVGDVIKNGETRTINSSIDIDLSSASSIEYSVKK